LVAFDAVTRVASSILRTWQQNFNQVITTKYPVIYIMPNQYFYVRISFVARTK